jgi:prevent-host-death family protein
MMKATAKDLRFHSKEILESVMRGEVVIITYRGKPSAKMIPVTKSSKRGEQPNHLFGIWADHEASSDVNGYVRKLRERRSK